MARVEVAVIGAGAAGLAAAAMLRAAGAKKGLAHRGEWA